MRIAIVAPLVTAIREPQGGGSQAFVSDLARGLAGRGHEVGVYAASGSQIPGVTVIDTGVDPESLRATLYRADGPGARDQTPAELAFARVYARVREAGWDVVHNHAFDAPAIALARGLDAPVVHTLHLPPDPAIADALRDAGSPGSSGSSGRPPAVAAVSQFQAGEWRRVTRVDAVLPPLVPTRAIGWSSSPGHGAVFAGRLSPEKGAAEAIDIARAAGVAIEVYGDAYDAAYAREQIGPRRGRTGVTLHGGVARATLWAAMARAAVVLCPSRWDEPFGMAAAEAQACGTPVVAFRRGGLPEVIADGVTGFLVAPGDLEAAADSLRKAAGLSRPACRRHAERPLDLERSLDAHEQLYERAAGPRGGTAAGP